MDGADSTGPLEPGDYVLNQRTASNGASTSRSQAFRLTPVPVSPAEPVVRLPSSPTLCLCAPSPAVVLGPINACPTLQQSCTAEHADVADVKLFILWTACHRPVAMDQRPYHACRCCTVPRQQAVQLDPFWYSAPAPMQESSIEALEGHVIVCGAEESFIPFLEQLRRTQATETHVVLLHPVRPPKIWSTLSTMGPTHYVRVSSSARQPHRHKESS